MLHDLIPPSQTLSIELLLRVVLAISLCLGLVGHSFLARLELLLVEQVVVLEGLHVLVELEDERACRRDVVANDLLFVHSCEVLDDAAE